VRLCTSRRAPLWRLATVGDNSGHPTQTVANRLALRCSQSHRAGLAKPCGNAPGPAGRPRSERCGLCVHSGTAPFSDGAYSSHMQLASIKALSATGWFSAVCIAGIAGNLNSLSSWAVLLGVAVLPPIVMMWRWNDPPQSLSESIQEARR